VALLGWVSAGPRRSRKAGISTPCLAAQAATPAAPRSVSGVSCGSTEVNLMLSATTGPAASAATGGEGAAELCVQFLEPAGVAGDPGAVLGQGDGDGAAETPAGAGDQCRRSGKFLRWHAGLP
jgi:hypothetical protein